MLEQYFLVIFQFLRKLPIFFSWGISWSAYSLQILAVIPSGPGAEAMAISSIASFIFLSKIVISERLFPFCEGCNDTSRTSFGEGKTDWYLFAYYVGHFLWIFIFTSWFQRSYFTCIFFLYLFSNLHLCLYFTVQVNYFFSFSCLLVIRINCFYICTSTVIRLLFSLIILPSSSIALLCLYKGMLAFLVVSISAFVKFSLTFSIFCTLPRTWSQYISLGVALILTWSPLLKLYFWNFWSDIVFEFFMFTTGIGNIKNDHLVVGDWCYYDGLAIYESFYVICKSILFSATPVNYLF